ncbi:AMP-binding protein [Oscillospiraceae bacterium OttesenSCG-928-F05]|nr:AMP-binding protein [Oscillospiraceae bacterium OttesenSCG-928-F05]
MALLDRFLPRTDFEDYADFKENFRLTVPENFDFVRDVVDVLAAESPEKTALLYCGDEGEDRRYTFGDIAELSKKAAAYLKGIGIRTGDRVLVMLRRRAEYWICATALHRLGATVIPASIQFTQKDIVYRINLSGATGIIYLDDPFVCQQLEGIEAQCATLRHKIFVGDTPGAEGHDFCREYLACAPYTETDTRPITAEFIAYFTSGTTSMPKIAIHNKTYPLGHIATARYMQHARDGGLHFTMADSGWAKFGWGCLYGQWICGSAILGYDPLRFDAANLMRVMERCGPTSLCVPPTIYRFLLRDGLRQRHVASVEWFSTAGEPLDPEVNRELRRITGHPVHEGFGQSEGTPITCTYEWLDVRPGSMGKPSPLYDVAIIGGDGAPCGPGDVGEVVIRTDPEKPYIVGLTEGYLTPGGFQKCYDTLYHTGDMAYMDNDGYYWFVGRNDDMIKCSGYRIGPFEVESVLNTHEGVRESAIIGRPDPIRGQVVCAVVALQEGYAPSPELTKELQDHVRKNTAPYKYPRIIEYRDALPKTTSGKIIRRHL